MMQKSIRLSPVIMEIIKKQLKISTERCFTLHALKPENLLSEFESVQKAFKQLTSFASKWESSVLLETENKHENNQYGKYTLDISISGPLLERVKSIVLSEQKLEREKRVQQELEEKKGFFSLKTILLTHHYFLFTLFTDEERNNMTNLINYMTGSNYPEFDTDIGDYLFETCSEALFYQFFDILNDESEDQLCNFKSINREVLDKWLAIQDEKWGGSERKVVPIE
ncbi:hypothetical protein QFZ81_005771 [Paenibacillus sp. V4I9]|uniref:hypothetical protein n=1 Tax=Paenibacillus sp. V4I9 TaxID=3042308 RepID=UPI002788A401|nr:hypothetical protein [Paenibacillus sp. V4I9]MDQ0890683.1 hypothetical protein [Paenibacillus sp. V4I9]